jgi:hypothetical protein
VLEGCDVVGHQKAATTMCCSATPTVMSRVNVGRMFRSILKKQVSKDLVEVREPAPGVLDQGTLVYPIVQITLVQYLLALLLSILAALTITPQTKNNIDSEEI